MGTQFDTLTFCFIANFATSFIPLDNAVSFILSKARVSFNMI